MVASLTCWLGRMDGGSVVLAGGASTFPHQYTRDVTCEKMKTYRNLLHNNLSGCFVW